jgi:hypothetical protein
MDWGVINNATAFRHIQLGTSFYVSNVIASGYSLSVIPTSVLNPSCHFHSDQGAIPFQFNVISVGSPRIILSWGTRKTLI